jgi:uncharacterized protein (TIRG00374 family)
VSDEKAKSVPSTGRRVAIVGLRLAGIALLALVLWQVGWRDAAHMADGTVLSGEIVGDLPSTWAADTEVQFRAADAAPDAPPRILRAADLATEQIGGHPIPVVNEGLIRIVRRADRWLLALGVLMFGFSSQFGVARWWLLLRDQGIRISFWMAHRLTFIGFFFNNFIPGATGGDLVKAVYAARQTNKRAEAVITVLVDRVTGVVALATIAGVVLTPHVNEPEYRELALFIYGFLGCFVVGCVLFFSRTVRRVLHVDQIAAKLPFAGLIKRLDEAIFLYRYRKKGLVVALLLSFANQISIQLIMVLFAHALHVTTRGGEPLPISDFMVVLPAAWMVSALPLLPGGWGARELAFTVGFHFVGVGRNPAVALSVMGGMNMVFWSLLGGIYVVLDRGAVAEAAAAAEEEAEDIPPAPALNG